MSSKLLFKAYKSKGIVVYAISVQNEPDNDNGSYPTSKWTPEQEAAVAVALRALLNNNGFSGVKIMGMDHNFDMVSSYAIPLMQAAGDALDGVAFHCYAGEI